MRIAVLTNDYPPASRGGAGVIAEIQVRELERRGHAVTVFCEAPQLQDRSALSRLAFHLRDLGSRRELVERILASKPEILLTHNLTGCGFATPKTIKREGVPWIHMLHDVQLFEPSGRIIEGESFKPLRNSWRLTWSRLRRRAFGHPLVVISPTQWLLDVHKQYGFFWSSKTRVVPNPVEVTGTSPGPSRIGTLSPRDFTSLVRRGGILFVGRLDRDKGIDLLIEAWRALGEDRPTLRTVGDGERLAELKALEDPLLVISGQQNHTSVLEMMKDSLVVVVPSLVFENQPTVILEALSQGCRVVASNVGGIPETLDEAGWLFHAGDVKALGVALTSALKDEGDPAWREEARHRILERHRVDVAVGALEDLLKSNL